MADNKEALPEPVILGTSRFGSIFRGHTAEQMHAFREAGVSELRAEVERLREALRETLRLVEQEEAIECRGFSCTEAIRRLVAASGESAEGGA